MQVDQAAVLPERAANQVKRLAAHVIERKVEGPVKQNKEFWPLWRLGSEKRFWPFGVHGQKNGLGWGFGICGFDSNGRMRDADLGRSKSQIPNPKP
jgi:hypothetical protein